MIRVQAVYRCRYCGAIILGYIREIADRTDKDFLIYFMDNAEELCDKFDPHFCNEGERMDKIKSFGITDYVGFNRLN